MVSVRVSIVGLDGMSWRLLNYLVEKGAMPYLSSCLNRSVKAILKSTIPPYTPVAWTSIFTGVNPGKHGVYCFHKVLRGGEGFKVELATSDYVTYPRINELAAMRGVRSIMINAPLTYPVSNLVLGGKGVVFTDWASPRVEAYPKEYGSKYEFLASVPPHIWSSRRVSDEEYVESVLKHLEGRASDLKSLLEREEWSLFTVVLSEPDWLQHRFPPLQEGEGINKVLKVFRVIDEFIRFVRELSDVLLIVSDHGFSRYKYVVNVNAILRSEGLLKVRKGGSTPLEDISRSHMFAGGFRKLLGIGVKAALRIAKRRLSVDFSRSKAFMVESESWGVYCANNDVRERVKALLSANQFIRSVYDSGSIYWGPFVSRAPDLVCIPREDSWCSNGLDEPLTHDIVDHHVDGIFIAAADDLSCRGFLEGHLSVFDIVPTALTCLGLPIPHDCDGRVVKEVCGDAVGRANYLMAYKSMRRLRLAGK